MPAYPVQVILFVSIQLLMNNLCEPIHKANVWWFITFNYSVSYPLNMDGFESILIRQRNDDITVVCNFYIQSKL